MAYISNFHGDKINYMPECFSYIPYNSPKFSRAIYRAIVRTKDATMRNGHDVMKKLAGYKMTGKSTESSSVGVSAHTFHPSSEISETVLPFPR